jgi:prepilin-type N-terminal cleavage/methylation domain-containing protein
METPLLGHSRFHNEFTLDDGFGMIEVVISLFVLSILSFSFIPLLVNSIKSTGTNTTIATATQIVNQQIEGARAVRSPTSTTPSCLDVTNYLSVTLASVTDPRGVTLVPKWDSTSCPSTYPGVVRARISVTRSGSSNTVAQATTLIFVASAT